jgi:hypothetical protein
MSGSLAFGAGPYGAGPWPTYTIIELAGVAQVSFAPAATLRQTWPLPVAMCATGTWTQTRLPSGPPNQLELAA